MAHSIVFPTADYVARCKNLGVDPAAAEIKDTLEYSWRVLFSLLVAEHAKLKSGVIVDAQRKVCELYTALLQQSGSPLALKERTALAERYLQEDMDTLCMRAELQSFHFLESLVVRFRPSMPNLLGRGPADEELGPTR